mmetsp:Transcript_13145/g.19388  ORF Transcript_13145/g.19388 Transcript_13145/m.19388 type:complete len:232 (+) Transcript_13145:713-1408(+)
MAPGHLALAGLVVNEHEAEVVVAVGHLARARGALGQKAGRVRRQGRPLALFLHLLLCSFCRICIFSSSTCIPCWNMAKLGKEFLSDTAGAGRQVSGPTGTAVRAIFTVLRVQGRVKHAQVTRREGAVTQRIFCSAATAVVHANPPCHVHIGGVLDAGIAIEQSTWVISPGDCSVVLFDTGRAVHVDGAFFAPNMRNITMKTTRIGGTIFIIVETFSAGDLIVQSNARCAQR